MQGTPRRSELVAEQERERDVVPFRCQVTWSLSRSRSFFWSCSFSLFFLLIFVFLFLHSSPFDVRLSSLALLQNGSKVMDVITLMKAQAGVLSWRTTTSWRNRSAQGTKDEAHNVTKWKHLWKYHIPDTQICKV